LSIINKSDLSDCVGPDLFPGRKLSGGLRVEESTISEHSADYVQETVGHSAQGA
jgi:hypothetical protein